MTEVLSEKFKFYCPQHHSIFEIAKTPRIVCEIRQHDLSNDFPFEEYWEYCCDCQTFSPTDLEVGGTARSDCKHCGRKTTSRFICGNCKIVSNDSGENTKGKSFKVSFETKSVEPTCPGCSVNYQKFRIELHKCVEAKAEFLTSHQSCPFCKMTIESSTELTRFKEISRKLKVLEMAGKLLSDQLKQFQTQIKTLQRQTDNISDQIYQQENESSSPPNHQPVSNFPVSAVDYLENHKANARTATVDLISGLLIHDKEKGSEFLIVKDSKLKDGLFFAVPNRTQFNAKVEYFQYFQKHFALKNPLGGTIWIKTPAIIERVEGGWKLIKKGELQVR